MWCAVRITRELRGANIKYLAVVVRVQRDRSEATTADIAHLTGWFMYVFNLTSSEACWGLEASREFHDLGLPLVG